VHQVLYASTTDDAAAAQPPAQQQQQQQQDSLQQQQHTAGPQQQQRQQQQEQQQPQQLQQPQGAEGSWQQQEQREQEQQLASVGRALQVLQAQAEVLYDWQAWLNFFAFQDLNGSFLDDLCSQLEAAVAAEDYATAAQRKAEILEVVGEDPVAAVRTQMQSALAAEEYKQLARLQEEGWSWLEGWWATEDGQLLRVAPE
jgi:hypothetical protein